VSYGACEEVMEAITLVAARGRRGSMILIREYAAMANLNKVMLIGRLTRDPESRTFSNGGKVTNFGFAANNRKKNQQTGQWEDEAMFIDCKVFNRGEMGKKADLAEQYLRKGHQTYLEGHLVLEQWDDKQTGQKRSKHVLYVDEFQFLEPKKDGTSTAGGYQQRQSAPPSAPAPMESGYDDMPAPAPGNNPQDDIPF
jgi:single-strand DNA-binding protein